MSGSIAIVYLDDSSNRVLVGINDFDRANGGILLPPRVANAAARLALTPTLDEVVYQLDADTFYRWDGATWQPLVATVSPGSIDHNALANLAVGDVHTQYLPLTGVRAMTGTLDMGGNRVDNIGGSGGVRVYGKSSVNPVAPAPSDGDIYYNTVISEWMSYDGSRAKWLSIAVRTMQMGRNGFTAPGQGYRLINGMLMTTNRGVPVELGTIISVAVTTPNGVASTFEVLSNNVVVTSLAHASVGTTRDDTQNADFSVGFLAAQNAASGAFTQHVQAMIQYKRRV